MMTKRSDDLHYLWLLGLLLATGVLLYLLGPILTPFFFAAILAYICDPLVDRLERRRVPRTLGVILVMLLLGLIATALVLILVPLFEAEVRAFITKLPGYLDAIRTHLVPWLQQRFGLAVELDINALKEAILSNWQSAGGVAVRMLPSFTHGGLALVAFLVNLVLVPVVLFYLLRDWDVMIRHIDEMIPRRWHATVSALARDIDNVLGEFLRGQLSVILIMCVFYVVGLWLVGLDFALPIGLMAGLLVFVPYLGVIIGVVLATLAALLQFQGMGGLIWVWVVFAIGQVIEGMIITPLLVGDRIGLHPVAVIFALMAFGQLFGFVGILLALPISAAILVWLRYLRRRYLESSIYENR